MLGDFLSIGEFSRVTMFPVKTPRFYADSGILKPAWIDGSTGCRWYSAAQFIEALRIRRLRELDMPLEAVREFLVAQTPEKRLKKFKFFGEP